MILSVRNTRCSPLSLSVSPFTGMLVIPFRSVPGFFPRFAFPLASSARERAASSLASYFSRRAGFALTARPVAAPPLRSFFDTKISRRGGPVETPDDARGFL